MVFLNGLPNKKGNLKLVVNELSDQTITEYIAKRVNKFGNLEKFNEQNSGGSLEEVLVYYKGETVDEDLTVLLESTWLDNSEEDEEYDYVMMLVGYRGNERDLYKSSFSLDVYIGVESALEFEILRVINN